MFVLYNTVGIRLTFELAWRCKAGFRLLILSGEGKDKKRKFTRDPCIYMQVKLYVIGHWNCSWPGVAKLPKREFEIIHQKQ